MGAHIFMDAVRWIGKLFHKSDSGEILIGDAVTQGINALDQVLDKFDEFKPIIEVAISDEGVGSIEQVEAEIKAARDEYANIQTFEDLEEKLVNVTLADDPRRNTFYHTLLQLIVTAFKDGKIDIPEATLIIATVVNFIKGN